jgi:hypothetical protein
VQAQARVERAIEPKALMTGEDSGSCYLAQLPPQVAAGAT